MNYFEVYKSLGTEMVQGSDEARKSCIDNKNLITGISVKCFN